VGHVTATVGEAGIAVLLSVMAGVPLGLGVGSAPRLRASLEPPIDWMRSIPATALFPLMLLFFGLGAQSRIAIATYGSVFPVVMSTMYGAAGGRSRPPATRPSMRAWGPGQDHPCRGMGLAGIDIGRDPARNLGQSGAGGGG
jgi:NitT/TauT family transport system permease protein